MFKFFQAHAEKQVKTHATPVSIQIRISLDSSSKLAHVKVYPLHIFEDQLLGEGVLGLGHLLVIQEFSFAHLPVDTCQDAEDIIVL